MHDDSSLVRGPARRSVLAAGAAAAALAATTSSASASSRHDAAARLLRGMTLEEKVGQLFVMRVYGASATNPAPEDVAANQKEIGVSSAAELIAKYHVGGIIYFAWAHNTKDPHQIADLSNGIQEAALAQPSPIPLLICTDQEHGAVARIGSPATLFPGSMALGAGAGAGKAAETAAGAQTGAGAAAGGAARDARTAALIAGRELAAMGVNQNYAPVADVNVNPANPVINVRSFGADAEAVAALVAAQVDGYQRAGVAATAKHFPGHGDTETDSHYGLPLINHTLEEWERIDAPPFRAAVRHRIDCIMTAHILVPALDPSGDPATLSRPILTGVLREQLGYDGVVVTDSLGMAGVRQKYGDDRVPVLALQAGCDQLLNPPDLDLAWNAVLGAVRNGELTERRIDLSVLRILRLKLRRRLFIDPFVSHEGVDRTVGTRAHLASAEQITSRTTTLLRNGDDGGGGRVLPLPDDGGTVLVVGADPAAPSGTGGPPTTVLARALSDLGHPADAMSTGTAPTQSVIDRAVAAAASYGTVVVATYNVTASSQQRVLVEALTGTGKPVVQVAIRNPYDVAHTPTSGAALATYSWTDVALRSAARVITGATAPSGRLPVAVPRADDPATELFPIGYGLTY